MQQVVITIWTFSLFDHDENIGPPPTSSLGQAVPGLPTPGLGVEAAADGNSICGDDGSCVSRANSSRSARVSLSAAALATPSHDRLNVSLKRSSNPGENPRYTYVCPRVFSGTPRRFPRNSLLNWFSPARISFVDIQTWNVWIFYVIRTRRLTKQWVLLGETYNTMELLIHTAGAEQRALSCVTVLTLNIGSRVCFLQVRIIICHFLHALCLLTQILRWCLEGFHFI